MNKDLGLNYINKFLSEDEESCLLQKIRKNVNEIQKRTSDRNAILRYGSKKPYPGNFISSIIPEYLDILCSRLYAEKIFDSKPNSVTINQYLKNQGIKEHVDNKESGDVIAIISLLGHGTMKFKCMNKKENFRILIEPRSLLQLSGSIRWDWSHMLMPVESTRYSLVFRNSKEII